MPQCLCPVSVDFLLAQCSLSYYEPVTSFENSGKVDPVNFCQVFCFFGKDTPKDCILPFWGTSGLANKLLIHSHCFLKHQFF